ncbi:MAG: cobalt ECF transporter T component CbiQ [Methanoregulaceae archaeon]|jgi:cobalt/nickel transport system permease protein|nr:cobalt ECF transporter T component CbiQ [Methanoregulaceae archaeon]MCU0628699.1 cobalt ECF transporter T component CbiQ [Methanoregulaceae archaeon]
MIEELFDIERFANRDSFIHRLDARVKIIVTFAAIVAMVAVPYSTLVFSVGAVFFIFFIVLWALSRLSPWIYIKRALVIISLWGIVILFQIFIKNPYYSEYHTIASLPFGISIYAESVQFAFILFTKFIITVSFVILLSSTTRIQDLLDGGRRLGLPADFALALGMMIRYLFVFGYMYRKIVQTLESKAFDPFDRNLPYRYRMRQIGYTIGTMFIRSYEQGERTYTAMLCRGYGRSSHLYIKKKPLRTGEWAFLFACFAFVVLTPVMAFVGYLHMP